MANISSSLADLAIVRSLLIQKIANGLSADVSKAYQTIIDNISRDIRGASPITLKNMKATIKELKSRFEVDTSFLKPELEDLAITESAYAASSVNSTVGVEVFSKLPAESTIKNIVATSLMSSGSGATTIKGWMKSVEDKSVRDIENIVKLGVISGETNIEIANRLTKQLEVNSREAMKITRTATNHISNVAREAVYAKNESVIKGYQKHETLDSNTCMQCAAVDGQFYKLNQKKPPATLHMNCRGLYIPVLKSWEDLGLPFSEIPKGTRSSIDGSISSKIDFEHWLDTKDKKFVKDWFGTTRYKMFKDKKLSLSDFVGQNGEILSVKSLREKYS